MRETGAGREHEIKLDAMRPGGLVPPQACDNRDNSADSRVWGFVDEREIYGEAVRVLVNFSDLKRAFQPL